MAIATEVLNCLEDRAILARAAAGNPVLQTKEGDPAWKRFSLPPVLHLLQEFYDSLHGGVVLEALLLGLFDHGIEGLPGRLL